MQMGAIGIRFLVSVDILVIYPGHRMESRFLSSLGQPDKYILSVQMEVISMKFLLLANISLTLYGRQMANRFCANLVKRYLLWTLMEAISAKYSSVMGILEVWCGHL